MIWWQLGDPAKTSPLPCCPTLPNNFLTHSRQWGASLKWHLPAPTKALFPAFCGLMRLLVGTNLPALLYNLLYRESCYMYINCPLFQLPHPSPYPQEFCLNAATGLFHVLETVMEVLFFYEKRGGFRGCRFVSSLALLVLRQGKPLQVLRGRVYLAGWWGVLCVAICYMLQSEGTKEEEIYSVQMDGKNIIRNWLYILSCCFFNVEARWDMLVSEITGDSHASASENLPQYHVVWFCKRN